MCIPDEWSSIPGNGGDRTRLTGQLMLLPFGQRWFISLTQILLRKMLRGDGLSAGVLADARPLRILQNLKIRNGRA